jgi:hypothetical protein
MPGKWSVTMVADNETFRGLRLPNTLALPASHIAAVVGHLLKDLYKTVLHEEHSAHLLVLIRRLDATERAARRSDGH